MLSHPQTVGGNEHCGNFKIFTMRLKLTKDEEPRNEIIFSHFDIDNEICVDIKNEYVGTASYLMTKENVIDLINHLDRCLQEKF